MRDECEHGNLRRQCGLCERDQKIEALQREVAGISREVDRQARRAEKAERKLEERGWRPIETAPHDGSIVWLYESRTGAMWKGRYDDVAKRWLFGARADDGSMLCAIYIDPSHWMTLPEPPKEGEA